MVRFLWSQFSTPKSDLSHCLFLFLLLRGSSFRRFQGISDAPEVGRCCRKGGQTGASTMRDARHPASTASPGSANPVLHRFCHSTLFCRLMVRSLDVRKHVLRARGSLLFPLFSHKPRLSIRSHHTARDTNQDQGAVGAGNDATWDREDSGLWSCNGGSVGA